MNFLRKMQITIPKSLENGPSLKKIPTLSNPIEPSTCCIFLFDVVSFFNLCI